MLIKTVALTRDVARKLLARDETRNRKSKPVRAFDGAVYGESWVFNTEPCVFGRSRI